MHVIRAGLRTGARLLVCTALLVGLVGTAPASAVSTATTTEALNVRSGPGTSYRVLGTLRDGQRVTTLSTSGGWTRIEFRDAKAYVAAKYLRTTAATPVVATPSVAAGSLRATTTAVNVRTGAGTSHAVLRVLAGGTRVTMTGRTADGFAEVVLGSRKGWVASTYLKATTGVPAVVGTRVATAALDIRSTAADEYTRIAEVKKGTKLSITGAVPIRSENRAPSSVADIATSRRSGLSAPCTSSASASPKSLSRLRSCTSSNSTAETPASSGSPCMRLTKMPSVTTVTRVLAERLLSIRVA